MEWARDGAGKESNLEWLLEFLRKEIERRERSTTFKEVTVGQTDKPDHIAKEEKGANPEFLQSRAYNLLRGIQVMDFVEEGMHREVLGCTRVTHSLTSTAYS